MASRRRRWATIYRTWARCCPWRGQPGVMRWMRWPCRTRARCCASWAWSARNRRPTLAELDKLMKHFYEMQVRRLGSIHMPKLIAFAIFSTRRQEEITRIRWEDLDESRQAVLVRDMKNPGQKIGNNVWCHLPDEAWAILQSMPKQEKEIFPYNSKSVSASFTRACPLLGIEDLHFHDLRHEGVSRLFEMD